MSLYLLSTKMCLSIIDKKHSENLLTNEFELLSVI